MDIIAKARSDCSMPMLRTYFQVETHAFLFIWFAKGSTEAKQFAKREITAKTTSEKYKTNGHYIS